MGKACYTVPIPIFHKNTHFGDGDLDGREGLAKNIGPLTHYASQAEDQYP